MLPPKFEMFPHELRQHHRWVTWKDKKVPYCATAINSKASATNPDTWSSFDAAQSAYEEGGYSGVGFVLNGDGIAAVDLDDCVHAGQPAPAAMSLMERIGCQYIELSPSGTGLHGFGYADSIKGKRGILEGLSVELYTNQRYLTVTGHTLSSGPLVPLGEFSTVANALETRKSNQPLTPQKSTEAPQRSTDSHLLLTLLSSVGCAAYTPLHAGQRNQCLFELARHAKADWPDASLMERRELVRQWHAKHYEVIGTKALTVSLDDFERSWDAVKHLPGATLDAALKGVDLNAALPSQFAELGYGAGDARLFNICMALQAHAGDGPFFLSARTAASLLGHSEHSTASAMLRSFVRDGVMQEVSKGAGNKASRYRMAL